MSNQAVDQNRKPKDQEEIGVVQNEPEQRTDQGTAPLPEEIGVVWNEPQQRTDQGTIPLPEEIGVMKNEAPSQGEPGEPEIGRIRNEPPGRK